MKEKQTQAWNGVIDIFIRTYIRTRLNATSALYQTIRECRDISTHYIKRKWEKELHFEMEEHNTPPQTKGHGRSLDGNTSKDTPK